MRRIAILLVGLGSFTSILGCAADTEEDLDASGGAAFTATSVLSPAACRATKVPNRATERGVFDGTLSTCFVAKPGETGAGMIARAVDLVRTSRGIAGATHLDGTRLFASFVETSSGSDVDQVWYDARVGLDIDGPFDAKGTIHFEARRGSDGSLTVTATNVSAIGTVGITPIKANHLRFVVKLSPAQNGLVVTGSVQVTLDSFKDSVGQVSSLAPEIVAWMKGALGALGAP